MSDAYFKYEAGLKRLLERLGSDHSFYADALRYQQRLQDNITQTRRYGDTETRRAERAQIVDALNHPALETMGISFDELCGLEWDESVQATPIEPSDTLPPSPFGPMSSEPKPSSLEQLWDELKCSLWGQIIALLVFLISLLEGLFGIFDVPPCPRRLILVILTVVGGGTILGFSFLPRCRTRYQAWDRRLTLGLLVISTGVLGWLTYQGCMPTNRCPAVTLSASPEEITPGGRASLTTDADDPESDPLDYLWEATASGLQNEGGPYKNPRNEYVAPPSSAGETVKVKVKVNDHHCGSRIEATTVIHIVLPSGNDTPTATPTSTTTLMDTPTNTLSPTLTPTPTSTPTSTATVVHLTDARVHFTVVLSDDVEQEIHVGGTLALRSGDAALITVNVTVNQSPFPRLLAYNYFAPRRNIPEEHTGPSASYVAPEQPGSDIITVQITDLVTGDTILRSIKVVVDKKSP